MINIPDSEVDQIPPGFRDKKKQTSKDQERLPSQQRIEASVVEEKQTECCVEHPICIF